MKWMLLSIEYENWLLNIPCTTLNIQYSNEMINDKIKNEK